MDAADRVLDVELRLEAVRDVGGAARDQQVVRHLVGVGGTGAGAVPRQVGVFRVDADAKALAVALGPRRPVDRSRLLLAQLEQRLQRLADRLDLLLLVRIGGWDRPGR